MPRAEYNLASSGVESPDLKEFEIETNPSSMGRLRDLKFEDTLGRAYCVPSSEVLPCAGSTLAIFLAIASTVKSGDRVLIPMPNYPPEYCVPRILGANVREVKTAYEERFQLDADRIAGEISRATKMVILTNSNNPTGLKIIRKDLEKITLAAEKTDTLVFVDETFREFADDPAPIARSLGDHVISVGSMTKFYGMRDIRLGWLFAERKIMEKIRSLNQWVSIEVSHLSSMIGIQVIEKKKLFEDRTRKMTKENLAIGQRFIKNNEEFLQWNRTKRRSLWIPKDQNASVLTRVMPKADRRVWHSRQPRRMFRVSGTFPSLSN